MEYNIGSSDRIVRLALGALLVLAGIAGFLDALSLAPVVAGLLLLVGLVLVVTGALQVCPAYRLIGMDTLDRR